jgi:hypothetical protein
MSVSGLPHECHYPHLNHPLNISAISGSSSTTGCSDNDAASLLSVHKKE